MKKFFLLCVFLFLHIKNEEPLSFIQLKNQATLLKYTGFSAQAISAYEEALVLKPDDLFCLASLSELYRATGQCKQGWEYHLYRFGKQGSMNARRAVDLSSIQGKKILIHREGGAGDNIQFIRYAQVLKRHGAYIIAQVHPVVTSLLSLCPYLDEVTGEDDGIFEARNADMMLWQQSLPLFFDTLLEATVPYLAPDPILNASWREKVASDKNFKIGICWQTNPNLYLEKIKTTRRSIPLKLLEAVMRLPNVTVYSLQKANGEDQIKELSHDVYLKVFDDLDTEHGLFMDTAALIPQLDLVLTVDTSIAHLAGALGARTWVMLPFVAEWRWMEEREDSPWYPTMRLFRQTEIGSWDAVIERVCQEIKKLMHQHLLLTD